MKLLKCPICGNIVELIEDRGVPVMCCGKPMVELKANTTDGALEKHVPVAELADGKLTVKVGSVAHPMLAEHYITMVLVELEGKVLRADLKPGAAPEAVFDLGDYKGHVVVYEFCNLHGLWKTELDA